MNYTGKVIGIKNCQDENPSVLIQAHHDPDLVDWFEWQTDLRKGKAPQIGDNVRCTIYGPKKICF